jgi:hypothetical protein
MPGRCRCCLWRQTFSPRQAVDTPSKDRHRLLLLLLLNVYAWLWLFLTVTKALQIGS